MFTKKYLEGKKAAMDVSNDDNPYSTKH